MRTFREEAQRIQEAMLDRVSSLRAEPKKKILVPKTVWEQYPVSPHEFINGRDFLHDTKGDIWPALRADMETIFAGEDSKGREDYSPICNVFLDCEGLGSGKSTKVVLFICYITYWLHCLKDPYGYFGLGDLGSTMAVMNIAPKEEKAKRIIYNRLFSMIHRIPWFRDMGYIPDKRFRNELRFYKNKQTLSMKKDDLDQFISPFLVLRPGSGKISSAVGEDLYAGIVDEACSEDGFELMDGTDRCEDIFEVMHTRRKSRFGDKGINMFISSAGTEDRWMERMIQEVEEHRAIHQTTGEITEIADMKIIHRRRPSYKANPRYKNSKTFHYTVTKDTEKGIQLVYELDIPVEFKRDMELKPEKMLRDICALPTLAHNPFFAEWARIRDNVNKQRRDPLPDNGNEMSLAPLCKKCLGLHRNDSTPCAWEMLPGWFKGEKGVHYYVHIDLGTGGTKKSKRDGAGLAIAHRGPDVEYNGTMLPSVVVDLAVRFKASKKKMTIRKQDGGKTSSSKRVEEIDIASVREFILKLDRERGFKFAKITYDGFQSLETLQTFQKLGYLAERVSCTKDSWDNLRTLWYDGRVDIFQDNWLLYEMSKLEDKGAKVDHAVGASDDEGQAVARAIEMAIEGEVPEVKKPRSIPRAGGFRGIANTNPAVNQSRARKGGNAGLPHFK